jgi:hypothetical protein
MALEEAGGCVPTLTSMKRKVIIPVGGLFMDEPPLAEMTGNNLAIQHVCLSYFYLLYYSLFMQDRKGLGR